MTMRHISKNIILLLFILLSTTAYPQFVERLSVSANVGPTVLQGDNDINASSLGFNIKGGVNFDLARPLAMSLNLGFGTLNGERQSSNFKITDMNFMNYELKLSFNLLYFIFESPFWLNINAGAGQMRYKVSTIYLSTGQTLSELGYGSRLADTYVTGGMQMGWKLNHNISLTLDLNSHFCNTDLIDGVAYGKPNDWFDIANVGVKYNFAEATQKSNNRTRDSVYEGRSKKQKSKCPRRRSKLYYYFKYHLRTNRWDLLG